MERVTESKARGQREEGRERNRRGEAMERGVKGGESICEEIPEGGRLEIKEEQMETDGQMETLLKWWTECSYGGETIKKG